MIDNHVHVGWYTNGYHSPKEVWQAEKMAGVDEIAVSSTSTCAELYKLVIHEMKELKKLGGNQVHPILWVTPRMMKTYGIRKMLNSKVIWEGIKMHWEAHREWFYNPKLVEKVMQIADEKHLPILLHTGSFKECHAAVFTELCKNHPNIKFVLAHGRPIDEAINVMHSAPNTYVDTAFMPMEDLKQIADVALADRILFGTDAPINTVYYHGATSEYISDCLCQIRRTLAKSTFEKITSNTVYSYYM